MQDLRRPASAAQNHGDILFYYTIRSCVQQLQPDHRAHPVAVRHPALRQTVQRSGEMFVVVVVLVVVLVVVVEVVVVVVVHVLSI